MLKWWSSNMSSIAWSCWQFESSWGGKCKLKWNGNVINDWHVWSYFQVGPYCMYYISSAVFLIRIFFFNYWGDKKSDLLGAKNWVDSTSDWMNQTGNDYKILILMNCNSSGYVMSWTFFHYKWQTCIFWRCIFAGVLPGILVPMTKNKSKINNIYIVNGQSSI